VWNANRVLILCKNTKVPYLIIVTNHSNLVLLAQLLLSLNFHHQFPFLLPLGQGFCPIVLSPLSHSPLFPICTPLCLHLISLFSLPSLVPFIDIVLNSDTICYNDPHYVTVPCLALFTHSIYTLATCHVNSV